MCEGVMADVAELKLKADMAGIDAAPTPHSCYTMRSEEPRVGKECGS